MIHPTDRTELIMQLDNMTPESVHLNLANACADSAKVWREIGAEALRTGNTNLAMFAQKCAWDNERIAEEERRVA